MVAVILAGGIAYRLASRDTRAWTTRDSWYRPYTGTALDWQPTGRQSVPFWIAESSAWPDCAELLAGSWSARLTEDQAAALSGGRFQPSRGTYPYLLRAVYLNAGTGRFVVRRSGASFLVHHDSLGHYPVPMRRQALIVALRHQPAQVYVDCSMAE